MILGNILPLIIVSFSTLSSGTIYNNNEDSVSVDNFYFNVNFNYYLDSVTFDYDSEFAYISFDRFSIALYTYNSDTQYDGYSELVYFEDLTFELPFYSTNISNYYIIFSIDDWTISENNINIDWIIDISYTESGESAEYIHYYTESDSYFSSDYIDVDEFLFYYDIGFEIEFYNVSEVYQGLKDNYDDTYDESYSLGYDSGYASGYENGFDVGSGENKGVLNFIKSIFNTINDLGNVEILPYIKIWYIIGIPVILAVVRFALGWFR